MWKSRTPPYVPPIIPESDIQPFLRSGMARRVGMGERVALIIVDVTRGFVDSDSDMSCGANGASAVSNIAVLLSAARRRGLPVVFTRFFPWSGAYAGKWLDKSSSGPGSSLSTQNAHEIVEALTPRDGEIILTKAKPSAFFGTQLVSILNHFKADTIVVTGLVTSGCVRATVVDGFSYNYHVIVPIECVGDRSEVSHQVSLFDMEMKYADVVPLAELLNAFDHHYNTSGESP